MATRIVAALATRIMSISTRSASTGPAELAMASRSG